MSDAWPPPVGQRLATCPWSLVAAQRFGIPPHTLDAPAVDVRACLNCGFPVRYDAAAFVRYDGRA